MSDRAQRIAAFLAEQVPPGSSSDGPVRDRWLDWHRRAVELGPDAPAALIRALAEGDQNAQYAAILALRHHGYEAGAEGYWEQEIYKVRKIGETEWTYIKPKVKNPKPPALSA